MYLERLAKYEACLRIIRGRIAKGEDPWPKQNVKPFRRSQKWEKPARPAWQTDATALPKRPPGKT